MPGGQGESLRNATVDGANIAGNEAAGRGQICQQPAVPASGESNKAGQLTQPDDATEGAGPQHHASTSQVQTQQQLASMPT